MASDAPKYYEPKGDWEEFINNVEQIESRATSLAVTEPLAHGMAVQFDQAFHDVRPCLPSPVQPTSVVLSGRMAVPSRPPGCPALAEPHSAKESRR